jgi:hypothetical protein
MSHAGLANFAAEQAQRYYLAKDVRALNVSLSSFDTSMMKPLLAVPIGATLVIVPPGIYGGDGLAAFIREHQVTHS